MYFRLIFVFIVYFSNLVTIQTQENYLVLNRAAELFQKEKIEIKNYRVKQEVKIGRASCRERV